MNAKVTLSIAATLACLLGCSTQHTVESAKPANPPPLPMVPPTVVDLRDGQLPPHMMFPSGTCKLGTSCLAMDPRPFEACLLSTKHCSDKAIEPLLVAPAPSQGQSPSIIQTLQTVSH